MMTSKQIGPIPPPLIFFWQMIDWIWTKQGKCGFFGSPRYLVGYAIFKIIVCNLEVTTNIAKNIGNILEAIFDFSGDFPRTE